MSAFDKDATTSGATDLVTEKFLEHLVGDGKKFTDQEALAKGKYESDVHVTNLERQLAELREDVDKSSKIDELMEMVRKQNEPKEDPPSTGNHDDTSPGPMSPEELKSLIETHVSERDTQTTQSHNVAEVDKALTEKFGEAAGRILNNKATDLNMSVDEMKGLAAKNPKAFYRLMGMDGSATVDTSTLLGGSQRSEGVKPVSTTKTWADYQEIRRKDKRLYYSPVMQQEIADARIKGGEAFFSNS